MEGLFEYLSFWGLSKTKHVDRILPRWSESELSSFLNGYLELSCSYDSVPPPGSRGIGVYADSVSQMEENPALRQLAMYVDRFYLHDPIPAICKRFQALSVDFDMRPRDQKVAEIRAELADVLKYLLDVKPLVAIGVATVLPACLSDMDETPGVLYDEDLFLGDGRPNKAPLADFPNAVDIEAFVRDKVRVREVDPITLKALDQRIVRAGRSKGIAIEIEGEDNVYTRRMFELHPDSEGSERLQIGLSLDPASYLDEDYFQNWSRAESQRVVANRLHNLRRDMTAARIVGATFLSDVPSSLGLIPLATGQSISAGASSQLGSFLDLKLPYLDKATYRDLATARSEEIAFEEFRVVVQEVLREISSITDPEERARRSSELVRDRIDLPMRRINQANKRLRKSLFIDSVAAVGCLAGVLIPSTLPLALMFGVGGASVLVEASKTIKEQIQARDLIRDTPGFFYWKATKGGDSDKRRRR